MRMPAAAKNRWFAFVLACSLVVGRFSVQRTFSVPKRGRGLSDSCQASALGRNPSTTDLEACNRPLPAYMLKASGGNEKVALRRWAETLSWRCDIDDEGIVNNPNPNYFRIMPHYPTYLHLPDKEGHLTYWELLGRIDMAALGREGVSVEEIRSNYVWQTLFTWDVWLKRDDMAEGTIVVDMDGFGLSTLTPALIQMFVRISSLIQKHFPEREHVLIIINAPSWWGRIYDLLGPLFPEGQRRKLRVAVGAADSAKTLQEFINMDNIPRSYGGHGGPLGSAPADVLKRKYASHGSKMMRR